MKKSTIFVLVAVLALLLVPALQAATWTGWITDAACAAKGAKAEHKACALKCAGKGEALVFYNNADQKIYTLDKQDEAKAHLGAEVEVTGDLDGDSIKVTSIAETKKAEK
jgi:hypothetical protein